MLMKSPRTFSLNTCPHNQPAAYPPRKKRQSNFLKKESEGGCKKMKKSGFYSRFQVFTGVFFLFTLTLCSAAQQMPTGEELELLRTAQTAQIIVEASFDGAKNVRLLVKETVEKLLPPAGLKHVQSNADIILKIELKGGAISRRYSGGQTHYTGAMVSGTIYLEKNNGKFFKKSFSGSVSPSFSVSKGSKLTPSSAPFKIAFSRSSFIRKVMEVLSEIKGNDLIYAYLANEDEKIREKAAIFLGNLKLNNATAVNLLIAALKDKNYRVRKAAVTALGNLDTPDSVEVEALLAIFQGKNLPLKIKAIEALGKKKDDRVIKSLLAALNDETHGVKQAAAIALGEQNDLRAVQPLMELLQSSDRSVRDSALQGLKKLADFLPVQTLLDFLKSKDDKLVRSARILLSKVKNPKAVDMIIASLKNQDIDVRKSILVILEKLKDYRAVEPLVEILKGNTTDKWEKKRVAEALESITGQNYGVKYKKWIKWWNKKQ
jgi:HEAT repeat protein